MALKIAALPRCLDTGSHVENHRFEIRDLSLPVFPRLAQRRLRLLHADRRRVDRRSDDSFVEECCLRPCGIPGCLLLLGLLKTELLGTLALLFFGALASLSVQPT